MRHVESFFFGRDNQLFGMYHPAGASQRRHGIIICPPLFHEYYRSHFINKRIAVDMAAKGFDVLRFDYSGTGDSNGAIPLQPFETWSRDIGDAIAEVSQLGAYKSVSVIAGRFSASLALPWQQELSKYICWDPVLDYHEYLEQIDATNKATLSEHQSLSEKELSACTENDFLGTGVLRATIEQSLTEFMNRLDRESMSSLPDRSIEVYSDVDWVSSNLEQIYAHDVIKQVTSAM